VGPSAAPGLTRGQEARFLTSVRIFFEGPGCWSRRLKPVAMGESLSGRAFAALDGSSPMAVRKARQAGHIVADAQGRYDPGHPDNRRWLARTKQSERRHAMPPAVRLEAAVARLERQEFEVATWRSFYVERAALGAWLHAHADRLLAALRAFPGDAIVLGEGPGARTVPRFVPLLWNIEAEHAAFATALQSAIAEHIDRMGDVHRSIERALDDAGADWRAHRPVPAKGMTRDFSWAEPATMAQVERRRAALTATMEHMKIGIRRSDLLAAWPAERVVGGLVIGWRQSVIEQFAVRDTARLLTKMARPVNHSTQWQLFSTLQGILKGVVAMAEHAVGEEHNAMRARFRPIVGSIAL
jgi:hypothetical protein